MDCTMFVTACSFDPGSQGSSEHGMADFTPVAPGWSAQFDSAPAISWGVFLGVYQAEFGAGGSFIIDAPGAMQLLGTLTSGVAFSFLNGSAETVASFQGYWNDGLYADGIIVGDALDGMGISVSLTVTTYTPEPGSFLLFGSALAGLAGKFRRSRDRDT